jgi:hypothetical protein
MKSLFLAFQDVKSVSFIERFDDNEFKDLTFYNFFRAI